MEILQEIVKALWDRDFIELSNPDVLWIIYGVLFAIIMLENGVLPAAFLPGDTLLILSGALVAKGVLDFIPTVIILVSAAGIGSWLGFLQGRWLSDTKIVRRWLEQLPQEYHDKANHLFETKGLYALLIGRFLGFVRTLLPILAGISTLSQRRFQLFNWLSGLLWIGLIVSLGYMLNQIPFIKAHEQLVMAILLTLPLLLLVIGLIGSLIMYWRYRKGRSTSSSANK